MSPHCLQGQVQPPEHGNPGICLQPPSLLLQGGCYSPISRVPLAFSMSPDNSASPGSCGKLGVLLSQRLTGWAVGSWTGRGLRGILLMGAGVTLPSDWARQATFRDQSGMERAGRTGMVGESLPFGTFI